MPNYSMLDRYGYYLVLVCSVGVAAAMAGLNLLLSDASMEAQRALRDLVEPLEILRTKVEPEEAVSCVEKLAQYFVIQKYIWGNLNNLNFLWE